MLHCYCFLKSRLFLPISYFPLEKILMSAFCWLAHKKDTDNLQDQKKDTDNLFPSSVKKWHWNSGTHQTS